MKTKLLLLLLLANFSIYAQTNLVPNADFEIWTSGVLQNWTVANTVTSSTDAALGLYSAKLSYKTASPKIIAQVPLKAGITYTIRYKYKYVNANYGGDHPIALNISKAGSSTTLSSSTFASNNLWTSKETTFTPDSDLSYDLSISTFSFDSAAFDVLIDDVQVFIEGTEQFTLIPDVEFEKRLIELNLDSGATDGKVLTSKIKTVKSLSFSSSGSVLVADLTGIQDFTALESLSYNGGSYSPFNGGSGKLKIIDLSKNINLTSLSIYGTQLSALDISKNVNLTTININGNKLTNFDTSANLALKYLSLNYNSLTSVDVTKNLALLSLDVSTNYLTTLDISKNTLLEVLYIQNLQWKGFDISKMPNLISFNCSSNQFTTLDASKNTKLVNLSCSSNLLTSLDVSANTSLVTFNCDKNKLTSLNLKNGKNTIINTNSFNLKSNPDLTCIVVDDALYSFTKWANYKDAASFFSNYDCTTVTQIVDAAFEDKLIALGIDQDGENGIVLNSSINAITSLDVSNSTITSLVGIEGFTSLQTLNISGNSIQKLNLSKNTTITTLNCTNNPALKCVQVADLAVAANWAVTKDATTSLNIDCNEYTKIPDANFEKKLIALGIDSGVPDGKVLTSNVTDVKTLNVYNSAITDLTGIADFISLTSLDCGSNQLTSLNVSQNTNLNTLDCDANKLTSLDTGVNTKLNRLDCSSNLITSLNLTTNTVLNTLLCSSNQLTSLDVSKNTALTSLYCAENKLTNLNVSGNKFLSLLFCDRNKLTNLDLSQNTALSSFQCNQNLLTNLDVSKNTKLSVLFCSENQLTSIDVSKLTDLTDFYCSNNLITNLDVTLNTKLQRFNLGYNQISNLDLSQNLALTELTSNYNMLTNLNTNSNTKLTRLICTNNKITSLDLSKNTSLSLLQCSANLFTTLDFSQNTSLSFLDAGNCTLLATVNLKNGNNSKITSLTFRGNPQLYCVQVDNKTYSDTNWASATNGAVFSTEQCSSNPPYTLIPDINFEKLLISKGIDKDGENGKVFTPSISGVTSLGVYDSPVKIKDLTGIEDFTQLELLYCYGNELTKLDVSKNKKLKSLDCSTNKLSSLDVSNNTALEYLHCRINSITEIDLSKNPNLDFLGIDDNKLTSIDISTNLKLNTFYASKNPLTSIDLSKNKDLLYLIITNTTLTDINISANKALKTIDVSSNALKSFDFSQNPTLYTINLSSNQLTSLNAKNGFNSIIAGTNLKLKTNPNLTCILVDDVSFSNTNWSASKDAIAKYNTECTGELTLPANNFIVETKGESCLGENNGEISISATQAFAYTATINDKTTAFTNNALKVSALTPGNYVVKITIPGQVFEQNFNLTIAKGASTTGKSTVTSKKVDVEITEGTAPFTVYVDGQAQFETNDANFSLDLNKGGLLEVATAKACEGVYSKKILSSDVLGALAAYPNPTTGSFEIEIPTDKNEVRIELYNFGGQLVSQKNYSIENGKAQLNLENQPSGIYAAKIYLDAPEYIKIIKK